MIKIFTTETCPKCSILKDKLKAKGIEFEESRDVQEIIDIGFRSVPILEINNEYLDFKKANDWINLK